MCSAVGFLASLSSAMSSVTKKDKFVNTDIASVGVKLLRIQGNEAFSSLEILQLYLAAE